MCSLIPCKNIQYLCDRYWDTTQMRVKMGRIQYLMINNLLMSFQIFLLKIVSSRSIIYIFKHLKMYMILFLLKISTRGVLMGNEMQQFKADFFKALSHPLRIGILELLSEGERSVNEIQTILNKEGSAVSQQLSVLRSKNIVVGTKDGKRVLYSLRDPMIVDLLVVARKIFNNHLIDTISMLEELDETERETIVKEG